MKFNNTETYNMEGAFRGMRNPLQSWERSDSTFYPAVVIGPKDMELAKKLIKGGSEHRKFLRQIIVSVDITAPLYWWKEFDQTKIATTTNSCSTMHTIMSSPLCIEMFEIDDLSEMETKNLQLVVDICNQYRDAYLQNKNTNPQVAYIAWKSLIRILPSGWLQLRTWTGNYENIFTMIRQRKDHKLNEWSGKYNSKVESFMRWCTTLPYAKELLFLGIEDYYDKFM